ncbi:unnamed protein product [Phytomonas sp. EM1]|nr:unnamed protein product [Phytomonas sp. EM1]|eukprot:CCW60866.1 unnamed protein product [Phytomonas sp. isolate EM1]
MRPGTVSDLSFNSSSDCSAHLVPLDENGESVIVSGGGIEPSSSTQRAPRDASSHPAQSHGAAAGPADRGLGSRIGEGVKQAISRLLGIESTPNAALPPSSAASDPPDAFLPERNFRPLHGAGEAEPSVPFSSLSRQVARGSGGGHPVVHARDPEVVRTEYIFVDVEQRPSGLFRATDAFLNPTAGDPLASSSLSPFAASSDRRLRLRGGREADGVGDKAEEEEEEELGLDHEAPAYELDLISALESYLENPNECFSHLVAAALASRSSKRPVTGAEVAAAQHNPFLVRLIVNSGCLDVNDPLAQRQVQETLDALIPLDSSGLAPTVYDHLKSLLKMPFVRLSYERYTLLKGSGFDYIILLHTHRHVLPRDRFCSILFNYSHSMLHFNWVLMLLSIVINTLAILSVYYVLVLWALNETKSYRINGIYALVVYGCGYVANIVSMVYLSQRKEDSTIYEDVGTLHTPPLYALLLFLPIYDVHCLFTFTQAVRRWKLVLAHNTLVLSRTSSICIAMWFVIPQILAQKYLIHSSGVSKVVHKFNLSYNFLFFVGIAQWGLALFRYGYMMIAYDSINYFGYASFKKSIMKSYLERHVAIPVLLNHSSCYVSEVSLYVFIVSFVEINGIKSCKYLTVLVIALSASTLLVTSVMFTTLAFKNVRVGHVSFLNIVIICFVVGIRVVIQLHHPSSDAADCRRYINSVFDDLPLIYVIWSVHEVFFILWLILLAWWPLRKLFNLNLLQRFLYPLLRRGMSEKRDGQSSRDLTR